MKKVVENQELKNLRKLAEQDPGLLEVIENVKAIKAQETTKAPPAKRLRMPYVNAQPLTEGSWK